MDEIHFLFFTTVVYIHIFVIYLRCTVSQGSVAMLYFERLESRKLDFKALFKKGEVEKRSYKPLKSGVSVTVTRELRKNSK